MKNNWLNCVFYCNVEHPANSVALSIINFSVGKISFKFIVLFRFELQFAFDMPFDLINSPTWPRPCLQYCLKERVD